MRLPPPNFRNFFDQNNAYRTQILSPHPGLPGVVSIWGLAFDCSRGRILGPGPAALEKNWFSVHYIHLCITIILKTDQPITWVE